MEPHIIKNVIFDIGNVIVRWSPIEITILTFGQVENPEQLAKSLFQGDIWLKLNKGLLSESEAKIKYQNEFGFTPRQTDELFYYVKHTHLLLFGAVRLLKRIKKAGYKLYALSDNVTEVVYYLKSTYDFWPLFDGITFSQEIGYLKPQPEIFNHLITQNRIKIEESVFIDDILGNVEGAKSLGFSTIHFENTLQCKRELEILGLSF